MKIAIIGSSTGGPFILEEIFTRFPALSIAIIIVQHLPPAFISTFRGHIAALTTMKVSIGEAGYQLSGREIIIAPAGKHMILEKNRIIRFDDGEKLHGVKPAVDRTMLSLRQIDGDRLLGIILTGMGQDGSAGIIHIRSLGGHTVVQDPSTAPIKSMPQAALDTGKVTDILTPKEISRYLQTF